MLPSFAKQTIYRIRPGTKTERGSVIPDWSPDKVDRLMITGCSVQPAATSTSLDGRVLGVSESYTAYIPENSDVKAGDHIEFEGDVFAINGEPKHWPGAFNLSHIQLNLVRWEG